MPRRLIITTICFHITAVLLVLGAIAVVAVGALFAGLFGIMGQAANQGAPAGFPIGGVFSGMGLTYGAVLAVSALSLVAFAVGIEFVVRGLNQRRYWAWIVGLVLCGLMIVNGLHSFGVGLALGGLSLWGLVDPETVAAFKPVPPTEN